MVPKCLKNAKTAHAPSTVFCDKITEKRYMDYIYILSIFLLNKS